MALKDLLPWKKKEPPKEVAPVQPGPAAAPETQGKEALLKGNYSKAQKVAKEINHLRSRLPEIMKGNAGQMKAVNEQLESIESALNAAKIATADLKDNDKLAVDVIKDLDCLLADPRYAAEQEEGLGRLQEALAEDWFQPDGMIRLERKLALVMALEGVIKAEIDALKIAAKIDEEKARLSALMDKYEANSDDQVLNAEIIMLRNNIERLKTQLNDVRTRRIEESNLLNLTRTALQKLPVHTNSAFAGIYESIEQEQAEELAKAIERVQKIRDKLIEDRVNLELAAEKMEQEGVMLSAQELQDIRTTLAEKTPVAETEKVSGTPETAQKNVELEV